MQRARRRIVKRVYEGGKETLLTPLRQVIKPAFKPKKTTSKLRLTKQPVIKKPFIDTHELPYHYGVTHLTLMVKDPFWIYAYWEVASDTLESLKKKIPYDQMQAAKIVLRMYDVTLIDFNGHNANSYFDIEVGPNTSNWYINLWYDNVSYIGEIGLRISDGRFFSLARSNYVHTPRMGYSHRTEQMWMKVIDEAPPSPIHIASEVIAPQYRTADRASTAATPAPAKKRKTIYLTEEEIRRYYSRLSPSLRDVISKRISRFYGGKADKYKFILEGEGGEEKMKFFSMLPKDYFIKKILLGSSEELVLGGSEARIKGPGGASEFMQERIRQHKFFFELNAEIVVYGRTEPDAEV